VADVATAERFTPYQLIVGTMTAIYALRNLDVILGLGGELILPTSNFFAEPPHTGPEPLTRLVSNMTSHSQSLLTPGLQYSRAYYRASYISTAFDAGFATAMTIRPKWFRDICSVALSAYYLVYAQEADEKVSSSLALSIEL
jgi:hypothetical protein